MKIPPFAFLFLLYVILVAESQAQIKVERLFILSQDIPDNGQAVDTQIVSSSGFDSITDVEVGLKMSSAAGSTMRLGDYYASLTHGTASEAERVAVLFNRPQMTNVSPFGSALSSADITLDDSGDAPNVFHITSNTGTFQADGRLSVDPLVAPVAYDSADVTHGLAELSGGFLVSNTWSLLLADTRQGAAGHLDEWRLSIAGMPSAGGTVDPGARGSIADVPDAVPGSSELKADFVVNASGAEGVTADIAVGLTLSGGVSGDGDLIKIGAGRLTVSGDASGFGGTLLLNEGSAEIASGTSFGNASSNLNVAAAATLTGDGTFHGNASISGTLAPGALAIGTLSVGSASFEGGGHYIWEISDAGGIAGIGWDLLAVETNLAINADSENPFTIQLSSSELNGFINFDSGSLSTYTIVSFGSVSGFSADAFILDASGLNTDASESVNGTWSIAQIGDELQLVYVPEPSATTVLISILAMTLLLRRRGE